MSVPTRIQRKRSKGWRMPPNTIYVGRPTKWGNPYHIRYLGGRRWVIFDGNGHVVGPTYHAKHIAQGQAVWLYTQMMGEIIKASPETLDELRGKNLACWCSIGEPCHCDALLYLIGDQK